MDPISALGLASNCLQFIDTGARFTSLAFKLYRHASDNTDEYGSMLKITQDLNLVLPQLKAATADRKNSREQSLVKLAIDCNDAATHLATLLSKIKLANKTRKRDALRAAFHAMCNEDEIATLNNQLASFRDQLNFHLLLCLRDYASTSAIEQKQILHQLGVTQDETKEVRGITAAILELLVSRGVPRENRIIDARALRLGLVDTVYGKEQLDWSRPRVEGIQLTADQSRQAQRVFLSNFQYGSMIDREARIAVAHETTFQWVFEDAGVHNNSTQPPKWSNLRAWLESNDQLYWVTGKAGSGKSTLMKYLCSPVSPKREIAAHTNTNDSTPSHGSSNNLVKGSVGTTALHEQDNSVEGQSRCGSYLKQWAGDVPIILASFYFWNSGQDIQAHQEGLLRTLLHQMFVIRPDLIAHVAPSDWEAVCLFNSCRNDWSTEELHEQLKTAIKILKDDCKICFFIDGLDEFGDDHETLVLLIKELLADNHHVKVCVASRPWEIFHTAFKRKPSLRLEDLTFNDIMKFVRTKFAANPDFEDLRKRYPSFADTLIDNIVLKASGVFLWVDLVVQSLLTGMRSGDRIQDFQRRLDELPPDLEKLYDKILHNLDPFYLVHAAQYFSLVETAVEPPTVLQFSFADEETPESAIHMPVNSLTEDQILSRTRAATKRLNSRCKGLLETDRVLSGVPEETAQYEPVVTIQYLHRTVRDYIKSEKAQNFLRPLVDPSFDPAVQLVCGLLMQMKTTIRRPGDSPIYSAIEKFFKQSAAAADGSDANIGKLVNQFAYVLNREHHSTAELMTCILGYTPRGLSSPTERNRAHLKYILTSFSYSTDEVVVNMLSLVLAILFGAVNCLRAVVPKYGLLQIPCNDAALQLLWKSSRLDARLFHYTRTGFRLVRLLDDCSLYPYPLLAVVLGSDFPNSSVVRYLLECGADPNFHISRPLNLSFEDFHEFKTPWEMTLKQSEERLKLYQSSKRFEPAQAEWKEILELLYVAGGHSVKISQFCPSSNVRTRKMLDEIRASHELPQKSSRFFSRK